MRLVCVLGVAGRGLCGGVRNPSRFLSGSRAIWVPKKRHENPPPVLDAQEEAALAEALALEEAKKVRNEKRNKAALAEAQDVEAAKNVRKGKNRKTRTSQDSVLPQASAETHSSEVYSELVRSNILANNPKDASDILEKMPEQGFAVSAGLCNSVILLWLEQPILGLKQAVRILHLMNTYKIKKNERSVAIGLMVALMKQDQELLQEMMGYATRLASAEKSSFEIARVSRYFFQHGGVPKADAAKVFIERVNNNMLRQVLEAARLDAAQASLTSQQPVVAAPPLVEEESLDPLYREQLNLETRAATDAVQKYRDALQDVINMGRGANTRPAHDVLLLWYDPLVREISEEQRQIANKEPGVDRSVYGPKLISVDAERLAVIAIHEALGLMLGSGNGVKFASLASAVGSAVQAECHFAKTRADGQQLVNYLKSNGELLTVNTVNRVARYSSRNGSDDGWTSKLCIKIGAVLIELLCKVARVPPNLTYVDLMKFKKDNEGARVAAGEDWPLAFRHEYRYIGKKKYGLIQCLPEVLATIKTGHSLRETVNARYLPMLVAPRPWSNPQTGGYLA